MARSAALRLPSISRTSGRRLRRLTTPEGVSFSVELADRGERLGAVLIDLAIMIALLIATTLTIAWAFSQTGLSGIGLSLFLLSFFLLRNFYFTFFELRWHGATPGKRLIGIRVADRNGGRLVHGAVFARNLMRELEMFLPIMLLFSGQGWADNIWVELLTWVWIMVFLLIPFFNKDRLRIGDIVGGTWVITAPRHELRSDVVDKSATPPVPVATAGGRAIAFTRAQLDIYGIYELQTLERVLRDKGPNAAETQKAVADRIIKKIQWDGDQATRPRAFLDAFYAALRQGLETRMLFGERRESKDDVKKP